MACQAPALGSQEIIGKAWLSPSKSPLHYPGVPPTRAPHPCFDQSVTVTSARTAAPAMEWEGTALRRSCLRFQKLESGLNPLW